MNRVFVGIGELLFDVFPSGRRIGGAPVNCAYHVAQLGVPSVAVSALGKDELGDEIVRIMDEKHISGFVPRVDAPTGTVQVELDAKGVPTFTITENVAWDKIPSDPKLAELAKNCCAVCFGTLAQRDPVSRKAIHMLLDAIPEGSDALVVYDVNLRQHYYDKNTIEASLCKCNVLKINEDEHVILAGMLGFNSKDIEKGCRDMMAKYGLDIVILTCGASCSHVFWNGGHSLLDTPKVEVVDKVGAGDAFTAAFCASLLKGKSIPEAHKKAVEVSAYTCTCSGAMPVLPETLKY